nr:hypothetical protein HmN_000934700 [Hymenolepis microstoma]
MMGRSRKHPSIFHVFREVLINYIFIAVLSLHNRPPSTVSRKSTNPASRSVNTRLLPTSNSFSEIYTSKSGHLTQRRPPHERPSLQRRTANFAAVLILTTSGHIHFPSLWHPYVSLAVAYPFFSLAVGRVCAALEKGLCKTPSSSPPFLSAALPLIGSSYSWCFTQHVNLPFSVTALSNKTTIHLSQSELSAVPVVKHRLIDGLIRTYMSLWSHC